MKRIRLLNGTFDCLTLNATVEAISDYIRVGDRGYLCTVNVAILMMMRGNQRLQRFVDNAAITVADGQPVVWGARALGSPLPERVAGIDLVECLCERASYEGWGIYLLGGDQAIVKGAAAKLSGRHPQLILSGIEDGYFPVSDAHARADEIARSGAKILIVAMGVPRQEWFIEEYWPSLGVNFAIGVGGSFDVIAGMRVRAPALIQRLGLEWLFRLVQEPRRLWKRYLVTNLQFLRLVSWELIRSSRSM